MNFTKLFLALLSTTCVVAQSSVTQGAVSLPPTTTLVTGVASTTVSLTVTVPVTSGTRVRASSIVTGVVLTQPTTFLETYTPTPTISSTSSGTPTPTEPPSPHLETKINGAFAVTGVLLILTGLPMAFYGHKNRW